MYTRQSFVRDSSGGKGEFDNVAVIAAAADAETITKIQDGRAHKLPVQNSGIVATDNCVERSTDELLLRKLTTSFFHAGSGVKEPKSMDHKVIFQTFSGGLPPVPYIGEGSRAPFHAPPHNLLPTITALASAVKK